MAIERKMVRLFAVLALTWAAAAIGSPVPVERLRISGNEFAEAYSFSNVQVRVSLENLSKESIGVDRIVPRRKGSVVDFKPGRIKPGESVQANIEIPTEESAGRTAYYFDVFEEGSSEPASSFAVRGFVDWLVDPSTISVNVGAIRIDEGFERVISISTRPGFDDLKLKSLQNRPKNFDVDIVNGGRAIRIKLKKNARWGLFDEIIVLDTNSEIQNAVAAHIRGQVRGGVIPNQDPVDFGMVRLGASNEQIIRLEGDPGKLLEIGKMSYDGTPIELSTERCDAIPNGCLLVRVGLLPMKERGAIYGNLRIPFPELKNELFIRYQGISIGKETQVRDFSEDMKLAAEQEVSVSSLLKSSSQSQRIAEAPVPDGNGPLITWQVLNETDVYGYEIYRSESGASGSFSRLNEKIVGKLASDTDTGSTYRWRDNSAISGDAYWYYISIVYLTGRKEAFTGPQKVVAK